MLSADGQVGTYSRTPGYSGDFSSDGDDIDLRWEIIAQKLKKTPVKLPLRAARSSFVACKAQ